ncbi:ER lumen protein retaining receptor-domain-containing protein [Lasiosphaeris hirsuta]|uniref:ER lumen protein retaining receptor-domain-containing protein n=1 Tax=Lasiosphaeris hirsuta TaxID=260670 RepID=A0AA40BCM2_9PEZI|nr:ER lumen protein retaining receptor-domain-containing protein [Lasiosphaeris hirsuta]
MGPFNLIRLAADMSHLTAKCILVFSIHRNRSAEGVSLITQAFYALVFLTRYTDFSVETSKWNYFFKVFYILSSMYTLGIMRFVYPRTREKEVAWKMSAIILASSLLLSPFVMLIFIKSSKWSFTEWLWVFSQILESVCVLPQLLLLRQTTVPTVITSFYIVFLGAYRALYVVNWFIRELELGGSKPNTVSVIFGLIQTALYIDFAWVYWTRQRVKLRNGGVVDADDLRRGWLLNRIFGSKHFAHDDEEAAPHLGDGTHRSGANNAAGRGRGGRWSHGISVSADEGLLENNLDSDDDEEHGVTGSVDPDAKMQDPDELARALQDEDDDDTLPPVPRKNNAVDLTAGPSGVRGGDEWNDD